VETGFIEVVVSPPRSSGICEESATTENIRAATPAAVPGRAVDPITLKPEDEVVVTTLADNVYDALVGGQETITRAPFAAGIAQAPQLESGTTQVGLMAEHGFSALVSVRTGTATTSLLFDTGLSPNAMVTNADRLGIDMSDDWARTNRRFVTAGVATTIGFAVWNLTLNATQAAPKFNGDAPVMPLSWAGAGNGVFACLVTALGLVTDRGEPAYRVVGAAGIAGLVAIALDLVVL